MPKHKGGKSKGKVSLGVVGYKGKRKPGERYIGDRYIAQLDAFAKGKKVVLSIPNDPKEGKAQSHTRVNAKEVWGDHKEFNTRAILK